MSNTDTTDRCSGFWTPKFLSDGLGSGWQDYWRGDSLHLPGQGTHALLVGYPSTAPRPTDGQTYRQVVLDFSQVSCLAQIANPDSEPGQSGEGFLVLTPDGTQYSFDWMTRRTFSTLTRNYSGGSQTSLPRVEVRLYPTRVEDRFGNTVLYTWSGSQLTSITASDGRSISFTYNAQGFIATATAAGRTWQYTYDSVGGLSGVQLPDGSRWTISTPDLHLTYDLTTPEPECDQLRPWVSGLARTFTFTHPSGAQGSFTFSPMRHGRTRVSKACTVDAETGFLFYGPPILRDNFALTQKTLSGPGLTTQNWTMSYSAAQGGYADCGSFCPPDTTTVSVTNPDNSQTVHTFGIRYYLDEGKLLRTQTYAANGTLLRDESHSYAINPTSPPYPNPMGRVGTIHDDAYADTYLVPRTQTQIIQDGATFTNTVNQFDGFARPTSLTRNSSLGYTKTEGIAYSDNSVKWVLGQVASVTDQSTGQVERQTDYDPVNAQPIREFRFGLLQDTLTYSADGTLNTAADGLNRTTTFANWKRGLPQLIKFADGTSQSAMINDSGWITSITDENGNLTQYAYDAMGRITDVTYPLGDTVIWTDRLINYVQLTASELGVAAGSWRRQETLGRFRKRTYFDARLNPILDEELDTTTGKAVYRRFAYDYENRPTFTSYPSDTSVASAGINQQYDALGRLTQRQTTDLVTLETIAWLSGFKKRLTDADGKVTTLSFQTLDQPDNSRPVRIESEESQTTVIDRDIFGHINSVTQSGIYNGSPVSATQTWSYDQHFQLCRKTEPETGSTVLGYDAAGQVVWQAWGQSGSGCLGSMPSGATQFTYDLRGRLTLVDHPGTADDITSTYDPAGNLRSVANPTATWTYTYNKRNLLESETAVVDGKTFTLDPAYNSLAQLQSRTYPDGHSVAYAPDAFGRPTQLGADLTAIAYYPNGLPQSYTYGNGLAFSQTLDTRQRPQRQTLLNGGAAVQDLQYGYTNGDDMTAMTDLTDGADSVSLGYDGLHRLTSAAGLWGTYTYAYDPLNNLRSRTSASGTANLAYAYASATNRLSSITGSQSRSYSYDSRGRVTADGQRSYTWSDADRITGIAGVATYAYDGHGQRIKATQANGTVEYALYDLSGALAYTDRSTPQSVAAATPTTLLSPAAPSPDSSGSTAPTDSTLITDASSGPDTSDPTDLIPPRTPANPSPGDTIAPGPVLSGATVTFQWTSSTGANQYNLVIYNNATGALVQNVWVAPGLSATQTTVSYTATLAAGTTYRWTVSACIHDANVSVSRCSNSTTSLYFQTPASTGTPPATPTGLSPGATTAPGPTTADKTVPLSWAPASTATAYTVQVFNTASGAQVVNVSTGSTSYSAALSYSTGYRWTVNACNSAGCSAPAATLYFQTPPDPNVETQTSFLSLAGQTLIQRQTVSGVTTVSYLHPDLLGSPRRATNAGKTLLWREHYDPYGMKLNGVAEKIGYTGHAFDPESGLTYMQARFYDPLVGRFLSADPMGFDPQNPFGFNRYSYANNNPYKYTDPTGMFGACGHQAVCDDGGLDGLMGNSVDPTQTPAEQAAQQGAAKADTSQQMAAKMQGNSANGAQNQNQNQNQLTQAQQQLVGAVAFSETTKGTQAEDEAIISVIVNRADSGDRQFVSPGEAVVNLENVVFAQTRGGLFQFNGVTDDPRIMNNFNRFRNGLATGPGARNAAAAAASISRNGPTNNATFFLSLSPGQVPTPGQVRALGNVRPAGQVRNVFLFEEAQ